MPPMTRSMSKKTSAANRPTQRKESSSDNETHSASSDRDHESLDHADADENGYDAPPQKMTLAFSDDENAKEESDDGDKDTSELDEYFDSHDQHMPEHSDRELSSDDEEAKYEKMIRKSRQMDRKRKRDLQSAEKELQGDMLESANLALADNSEAEDTVDVETLKQRIQNIANVLSKFRELRDPQKPRQQYVRQLLKDLCNYYGYSDYLMEKLYHMFPVSELIEFLEASEVPRPVTIRVNTLKTKRKELAQALIQRGVNVDPIEKWSRVGLQVFDSPVPIGATPEYLSGHYMLQAAASFLPVMALAAQENERVLDMCAAPGGKACYIAAMMKNTGCLFANDVNKDRLKAAAANCHRMGITNAVLCSLDGREFPSTIGGFDRVLLDAPCSGTGVISKDPSVKVSKTSGDFKLLTHVQKELILAAIDSIDARSKTGGILVYSTCSVNVEENEEVVQYALRKRPNVKLVPTGLDFGKEGYPSYRGKQFHPLMSLVRRYYPHMHNLDGFFVAKLKKTSNKYAKPSSTQHSKTLEKGDALRDHKPHKISRQHRHAKEPKTAHVKPLSPDSPSRAKRAKRPRKSSSLSHNDK